MAASNIVMAECSSQNVLNDRELEVFEAMKHLSRRQVKTPTQSEIAEFLGSSQPTVHRAMNGLEQKGFLESDRVVKARSPRSYRITNFRRSRKKARQ